MKVCFEFPNKIRYNTLKSAEAVALSSGKPLRVYKCETCKG
jgi:hypothetical protein